jgi:CheY-like chemotaxis protein
MVPVMGRPRVLLGDSSRAMLVFMELLLEPHFQVLAAVTDGEALVLAAKGLHPDVVILDFSLSFLDSLGTARQLRDLMPDMKVVSLRPTTTHFMRKPHLRSEQPDTS